MRDFTRKTTSDTKRTKEEIITTARDLQKGKLSIASMQAGVAPEKAKEKKEKSGKKEKKPKKKKSKKQKMTPLEKALVEIQSKYGGENAKE